MNQNSRPECGSPGCFDHLTTPAPLDPTKVKAGDMVTLEADGGRRVTAPVSEQTLPGKTKGTWFLDVYYDDQPASFSSVHWTLTDHQPAPEPEWKPGTVAVIDFRNGEMPRASSFQGGDYRGGVWLALSGAYDGYADEVTVVRPLVVIDPAAVDVDALAQVAVSAHSVAQIDPKVPHVWRHVVSSVLAELGIRTNQE